MAVDTERAVEIVDELVAELYSMTLVASAEHITVYLNASLCVNPRISSAALLDPTTGIPTWLRSYLVAGLLTEIGSATKLERLEIVAMMVEEFGIEVPESAFENLDAEVFTMPSDEVIDLKAQALGERKQVIFGERSRNDMKHFGHPYKPVLDPQHKAYDMNFSSICIANQFNESFGLPKRPDGGIPDLWPMYVNTEVLKVAAKYPSKASTEAKPESSTGFGGLFKRRGPAQ